MNTSLAYGKLQMKKHKDNIAEAERIGMETLDKLRDLDKGFQDMADYHIVRSKLLEKMRDYRLAINTYKLSLKECETRIDDLIK